MPRDNGGFLGPTNFASIGSARGIFGIVEQLKRNRNRLWPPFSFQFDYLIVAGGGGGGYPTGVGKPAGAGAGGFRTGVNSVKPRSIFNLAVGAGGAITAQGGNSHFITIDPSDDVLSGGITNSIVSRGGGLGGIGERFVGATPGGSGGGSGSHGFPGWGQSNFGIGNIPEVFPSQGNNGSPGAGFSDGGGAGGGAGQVGFNSPGGGVGGRGGNGMTSTISGSSIVYAGGGGGTLGGAGGTGGGGADEQNGDANRGGGGGGNAAGGSGIVIFKYLDTINISNPGGGLTFSTPASVGGFKITTFTAGTGNVIFDGAAATFI